MAKSTFQTLKNPFPFSPQLQILFSYLSKNGDELRIVGGAVRDFLANKEIADIDLACKFPPEKTIDILEQNQIKTISSGIKYGTITAIIDKEQFQITTLRKDIENFGRDCEVEFVDDFFVDAKRRDFTINALSIDFKGRIYDYFGGIEDLKNQIVRFIGDSAKRIQEDYLRILRFFRFSCYYAKNLDLQGLQACIKYKNHLLDLSQERIRIELFKIFECKNRDSLFSVLQIMYDSKILEIIFGNIDKQRLAALKNLFQLETILGYKFESLLILAIISDGDNLNLSLSKLEKKYLQLIKNNKISINFQISEKELLKLLMDYNKKELLDIFTVKLVLDNNFENLIDDFLRISKMLFSSQISNKIPYFPINGYDLIDLQIKPQDIGKTIKIARNYWWENDFVVDKSQILSFIKNNRD